MSFDGLYWAFGGDTVILLFLFCYLYIILMDLFLLLFHFLIYNNVLSMVPNN
uniref:Uncharacterized protein n=1 Tax=Gorilla gorilla gorilla TaxID=9595 RepID=A0A2I2ZTI6_GORGO